MRHFASDGWDKNNDRNICIVVMLKEAQTFGEISKNKLKCDAIFDMDY